MKIIQIAAIPETDCSDGMLWALTDTGHLFRRRRGDTEWEIDNVPPECEPSIPIAPVQGEVLEKRPETCAPSNGG